MTKTQIFKTKHELLNEMIAYYSSPDAKMGFENNSCVYRTEDGGKCAVGCLISESAYDPRIESGLDKSGLGMDTGVTDLAKFYPEVLEQSGIDPNDQEILWFLQTAQRRHDTIATNMRITDTDPAATFVDELIALKESMKSE